MSDSSLPDELRWQLRALRRDEHPGPHVWSRIESRLPLPAPKRAALAPQWIGLAAGMLLVVGALGWWRATTPAPSREPSPTIAKSLVQREAEGMTRQYEAALRELPSATTLPVILATYDELDRSAATIRAALAADPDSRLLLEQLQRTYARRLALAQRVAYS